MRHMMKALAAATVAAAVAALPMPANAQVGDYPNREVRFIIGFAAGGGADVLVRFFANKFKDVSGGKTFIVENKVGAAGALATKALATAKPDGYTIGLSNGYSHATAYLFYKDPPAKRDDLELFGTVLRQGFSIAVDAKSDIKTLADLTAHLRKKGDKGSYGTAHTIGQIMAEFYRQSEKLPTVQVNYRSAADGITALVDGLIDFAIVDPGLGTSNERAGRIRNLALSSAERIDAMPGIPTMKELGYDFDAPVWWAGAVPKGTPKPIVDQLQKWMAEVLKMPDTIAFLKDQGSDPWINDATFAEKRVDIDAANWAKYAKIAGIQPQ